jgi:hypothetical protein
MKKAIRRSPRIAANPAPRPTSVSEKVSSGPIPRAVEQEGGNPGAEIMDELLLWTELDLAHLGVQTVGADQQFSLDRRPVVERGFDPAVALTDGVERSAEADLDRVAQLLVEDALDVAPHHVELAIADEDLKRAALQRKLLAAVGFNVEQAFGDVLRRPQALGHGQALGGLVARVRQAQHVAARAELGRPLDYDRLQPVLAKAQRQGKPGDARAGDQYAHEAPSAAAPQRGGSLTDE